MCFSHRNSEGYIMSTLQFLIFLTFTALGSCLVTPTSEATSPTTAKPTGLSAKNQSSTNAVYTGTPTTLATSSSPKVTVNTSLSEPVVGEAKGAQPPGSVSFFSLWGSKKSIGDACKTTDECQIKEAFCINGTCQCSSEYVPSTSKNGCLFKAKNLLDVCIEDAQCEAGMNATGLVSCLSQRCRCAFDAHIVHGKCYKKLFLGKSCQVDEECAIEFSSCIQNVCACDSRMEPDEDNTRCIIMRAIDASTTNCTDDFACSVYGEQYLCRDGVCGCKPGYHFSSGQCVPELKLGDPCDQPNDCSVDLGPQEKTGLRTCVNQICSCIKGYKGTPTENVCKSGGGLITVSYFLIIPLILVNIFTHV